MAKKVRDVKTVHATKAQQRDLLQCEIGIGLLLYKSGTDTITEVSFYLDRYGYPRRVSDGQSVFGASGQLPTEKPKRPMNMADPEYDHQFDDFYGGAYDFLEDRFGKAENAREGALRWAKKLAAGLYGDFVILAADTVGTKDHRAIAEIAVMDQTGKMLLNTRVKHRVSGKAARQSGKTGKDAPMFRDIQARLGKILQGKSWLVFDFDASVMPLSLEYARHHLARPRDEGIHLLSEHYARFQGASDWDQPYHFIYPSLSEACALEGFPVARQGAAGQCQMLFDLFGRMVKAASTLVWSHPMTGLEVPGYTTTWRDEAQQG